jgi:hypothetical protein
MSITRRTLSSLVASQLPEFVREDNQTFVSFLEAYYEYLQNQDGNDLKTLGDIDNTLDSFIKHFKNELAANLPTTVVSERFLLQHIKEHYLAKGSEESFKLLFRLLFNKDVTVEYPSKQMLRASDGKWNQDVSIICKILTGHPDDIVGKLIDVITPNKIIRVLIDRRQYVEVEVERVVEIAPDVYEFYIDRRFFGNISIGDRLRYQTETIYFTAEILATTSKLQVLEPGTGFKVGQLYPIRNGAGYGSIMKVTKASSEGGIISAEFIKFGVGYTTDFTSTIYADLGQSSTGTGGTSLQVIGGNISINETTDGFTESGTINRADYSLTAIDGTYAGEVLREFGNQEVSFESPFDPAVIKVSLGPLGKYPGYYINNDGFLDDAIFIQDSRYYQAFSYVLKIDERLDTYKSIVKALVHPAGMAVFGEYDIRNEFDIGLELESMIKILAVTEQDEQFITDTISEIFLTKGFEDSVSLPNDFISTKGINKPLEDSTSYSDVVSKLDFGKLLNGNGEAVLLGDDGIAKKDFSKSLTDIQLMTDNGNGSFKRDFGKRLDDIPVVTEMPYLTVTKYIDPAISGVDDSTIVDSGGFMIKNPYADAGWFLEQYVGEPINF